VIRLAIRLHIYGLHHFHFFCIGGAYSTTVKIDDKTRKKTEKYKRHLVFWANPPKNPPITRIVVSHASNNKIVYYVIKMFKPMSIKLVFLQLYTLNYKIKIFR